MLNAIKKGDISIDAGYVSTNTSASNDEELLQLFYYGKKFEKLTGKPVQTLVQTDIPGMSWGIVPAASQMGIKYVLSLFNGSDRTGWTHELRPDLTENQKSYFCNLEHILQEQSQKANIFGPN